MRLRIAILLLAVTLFASVADGQRSRSRSRNRGGRRDQCHLKELEACMNKMRQLTKSPQPSELIATSEGVEKICKTAKEDIHKCAKAYIKKCGTPLHREVFDLMFDQILLRVKKFCDDPKEKKNFLQHSPCMHEKVFSQEAYKKDCNNKFLQAMDTVDDERPGSNPDDTHQTMCCGFNRWNQCTTELIKGSCGQPALGAYKQFLGRSFGTVIDMFCPEDAFVVSSDKCKKSLAAAAAAAASSKKKADKDNAVSKYVTSLFSFLFVDP